MRTVLRIAQNKDGTFEGWNLTHKMETPDIFKLIGLMEVLKKNIVDSVECEEISQSETDDIRKLLD